MATVIPYRALRYSDEKNLDRLTTPPYDIISPSGQDAFYAKDPHNVIRLEYGKMFDGDTENDNRYTRAGEFLKQWLAEGVLKREDADAFYIYEQLFTHKGKTLSLKGLIGRVKLCDFSEKVVLPHEETLSKAKEDRFNLMKNTDANFSQIYSLYLDPEKTIPAMISALSARSADISFTAFDGLRQNLWIIKDRIANAKITEAFSGKQLFIADGHHRYETALRYRDAQDARRDGGDGHKYCMMFLVEMEDPGLVVFPTHRLVRGLADFDEKTLVEKLAGDFAVEKRAAAPETITAALEELSDENAFALYTGKGGHYYILTLKNKTAAAEALPGKPEAYRLLDVSVLHSLVLEKRLGIDKENMAKQLNLTYTRDLSEAVGGVDAGEFQCAFLLNGTKVSQIKDISLINEKMPQKSTYFYPKLVTGIVMNGLRP